MSRTTPGPLVLVALLAALAVPTGARAQGWIVSATPSATTARLVVLHGARPLRLRGTYLAGDRALAAALRARGLLRRAERDVPVARAAAYEADPGGYARGTIVAPGLTPPTAFAPIGLVDDVVDATVPDVAQARVIKASPGRALDLTRGAEVAHGTEVASVAAGRADGQGVIGVAPGAPLLSYGYKTLSCAEVSDGLLALADAGAKVINVSFEAEEDCHALRLAVAAAFGTGAVVVAAAGNEGDHGDPTTYPAAYPHVLTVGALDLALAPAGFSSTGAGLDLAAPGEAIPVAVPPALDRDGTADGVTRADGTSLAAPMVSGAASWLIAARPRLAASQYADLLRGSARDVGAPGWDVRSGFGAVDLAQALTAPVPPADRGEPNDDVEYVDGTDFERADPTIYSGGAARTVTATAAAVEDPADVYRIRLKGRARAVARLSATAGLTLAVYAGGAKSLKATPVARGGRTLRVRNPINKSRTYYVVVRAATAARSRPSLPYALKLAAG